MKEIRITRESAISNLKKNKIKCLLIFLLCLLIGIVTGWYQSTHYHSEAAATFTGEPEIDLSDIEKDGGYYFNAFDRIQREMDWVDLYFRYLQNVRMSQSSRDAINDVREKYNSFCEDLVSGEPNFFWNTALAASDREDAIAFIDDKAAELSQKKEDIEFDLENAEEGTLSEKQLTGMQTQLSNIEKYLEKWDNLRKITEKCDDETLQSNNAAADERIEALTEGMNGIIADFNDTLEKIASDENYEILFNKAIVKYQGNYTGMLKVTDNAELLNDKLNQAIIYAKSIEGLDVKKERFYAMVSFFLLFGIIVSVTFGVLYSGGSRKEKEESGKE